MSKKMMGLFVILILTFSFAAVSFAVDQRTILQSQQELRAVSSSTEDCSQKICDATIEAVKMLEKTQGLPVAGLTNAKTCKAVAEVLRQKEKEISTEVPARKP